MSWIERTEQFWNGLNLWTLKIDEAYVNFTSVTPSEFYLYSLSEDCDKCPYQRLVSISETESSEFVFKIETARQLQLKLFNRNHGHYEYNNNTALCHIEPSVGEFGVYNLNVGIGDTPCTFNAQKDPVNVYLSILTVFLIYAFAFGLLKLSCFAYRKYKARGTVAEAEQHADESKEETEQEINKPIKKRLKSLDTFRGVAIVLMIFANSGAGHYWWIEHATWNGLHIADLVFPFFLWIMGVCIPISVKSQMNRNVPKLQMLKGVVSRSVQLFLIGVLLNSMWGSPLQQLRIFGVLQRFGIAYLVVSTVYIVWWKDVAIQPQNRMKRALHDIILIAPQWCIILLLTTAHLLIVFQLPVPDCPRGYFGPGGIHEMSKYPNCIGGAVGHVDRLVLGLKHMYQHPAAKKVYDSLAFDPEGVLGCLPTILQVFIGLQCGMTLVVYTCFKARAIRWLSWGCVLGLCGGLLSGFSTNDGIIPVNKNLWSLSFVFVTSALAFFGLTICYLLIDVQNWWNGAPFIYPGMNAIIMYVGHSVFHQTLPWRWRVENMNTHFLILFENVWNTTLWICIAYYLYRRKFFYSL